MDFTFGVDNLLNVMNHWVFWVRNTVFLSRKIQHPPHWHSWWLFGSMNCRPLLLVTQWFAMQKNTDCRWQFPFPKSSEVEITFSISLSCGIEAKDGTETLEMISTSSWPDLYGHSLVQWEWLELARSIKGLFQTSKWSFLPVMIYRISKGAFQYKPIIVFQKIHFWNWWPKPHFIGGSRGPMTLLGDFVLVEME